MNRKTITGAIVAALLGVAAAGFAGGLESPLGLLARGIVPEVLAAPGLLPVTLGAKGETRVPVLIRTEGASASARVASGLPRLAANVGSVAGPVVTATVDARSLEAVADLPGVLRVELGWPLRPLLDVSAPASGATRTWGELGVTGAGAVVGVVDTGIAWDHRDFIDEATGVSRVAYLWDQTGTPAGGDASPGPYGYGVEYARDRITAAIAAGDRGALASWDTVGHGTHCAGISAGNGRATGNGYAAGRYVGMAPEADLVVVRSNLITPLVLDGIRYVFERADALGEPAAVNLSLGSHVGAHDGTTAFDLGIDALVGPGHVVVAAAGNENDLGWHARTRPAQGEVGYFTIEVDSHQADDRMPDVLAVAAYTPAAGQYTVTLRSPNGATAVAAPGQPGEYIGGDGMFMVDNGFLSEPNELNGLTTVLIAIVGSPLAPGANRNLIPPGTWTIEIAGDVVPAPADVHAWVMQSLMGGSAGCCASFGVSREDGTMVASPASAMRVIAVGAYMTKLNWTNPDGTGSGYGGDHAEGDLAFFSCVGPTRDGRIKPEIAAPGFGVAAAMSEGSSIAADYASHIVEDGVHIVLQGTSMAAPHGTGAAALLLSQFPHATPEDVRALIRRGGRADAFVGEAPNPRWGWGKLDVYTSLVGPTDDDDTGPGDDDVADDDADDGADAGADDDDGACCG